MIGRARKEVQPRHSPDFTPTLVTVNTRVLNVADHHATLIVAQADG
jgi:hypothetical protein